MKIQFSALTVVKELAQNQYRTLHIALHDLRTESRGFSLGYLWNFLSPALQVGIYWMIFGFGLRTGPAHDGIPYLWWLLAGMIPWYFVSQTVIQGSASVNRMLTITSKMRFPYSILPASRILYQLIQHLIAVSLVCVLETVMGHASVVFFPQVLYYALCASVFIYSLSLTTSSLCVLSRDFAKFLPSVMRLVFFLTPALWSMDRMPESIHSFLKANPFYYIIVGYRESILYGVPFYDHPRMTVYFWCVTLILFLIGSSVHIRTRQFFTETGKRGAR